MNRSCHSCSPRSPTAWRKSRRVAPALPWRPASFQRGALENRAPSCRSRGKRYATCRLLAGDEVGFGPTSTRLRNTSTTPTPVHLLAAGPRMIELAGEVADGAFLMVGLRPASVRVALRRLKEGARRSGRSLADFPVVFVVTPGLGPDADVGARWVRTWFAPEQPFLWTAKSASAPRLPLNAGTLLPLQALRRPLGVAPVRARHVLRQSAMALSAVAPRIGGNAFAAMEYLDRPRRGAGVHLCGTEYKKPWTST